ncbi:MAG: response regulator transcription factor [Planctomycetes bacterium]|jgi:two-component system copper resistance phosphate regulon response regulator CusR|nr:response regulator transcription factor [Planctomycetota bacterium]
MAMRLLVIEDDDEIAEFIVRGLREEGFVVDHVTDGISAWHTLQSSEWDVVILDLWLPGQDGLAVLRKMRQANNATPVLILTARDSVENRVEGLNAGADDYLGKPFAFTELLARVHALLRRRTGLGGTRLQYEDVSVDIASQRAERAGQPLTLAAREQALLVFFLRHPEEVLTRTRIYEQVWDERYDGMSNTLEVHVMELRRKLEQHGPRLIHTVRGRGYVLSRSPTKEADG